MPIPAVAADPQAREIGERLFLNYCAQCHASDARGGKGFPNLTDKDWLWGSAPDTVLASIQNGRTAVMPGWEPILGKQGVENVLAYVMSLSGRKVLNADVEAMKKAFPAASVAYERHVQILDRWMASIQRGAARSNTVIAVADALMIAVTFYNVWKVPALRSGSAPSPPTIVGFLPGGIALGSRVNPASLANLLESIRRLVAIGALDGAILGGVGLLGGGPNISLPELQRPTSLSVAKPSQPSGNAANPKPNEGRGPPPAADNYRGRYNAARAAQGKARLPKDWEAHHRIPQKYRNHPGFKGFDFDDPSNIQGVRGWKTNVNTHQQITNLWGEFDSAHPNPTRKQIEEFARFIDSKFQTDWWN